MALDLNSIANDVGKTVAEKLDKELDDGIVQSIVGETLRVVGGIFNASADELQALNNNADGN